jgi:hypothetical protein
MPTTVVDPYQPGPVQVIYPPVLTDAQQKAQLDNTDPNNLLEQIVAGRGALGKPINSGDPVQHKERYKRGGSSWSLSTQVEGYKRTLTAGPILMKDGAPLKPLEPLLSNDAGLMIIHIEWPKGSPHFLCSPSASLWIDEMRLKHNPHRSPVSNGQVEIKPLSQTTPGALTRVGATIPVITVHVEGITDIGDSQQMDLKEAGVADVIFIYETVPASPETTIPQGLIDQINYTIVQSADRALGQSSKYIIKFLDNSYRAYIDDIRKLVGKTTQEQKVYYLGKLDTFQVTVYPLWNQILKDFNALKDMFFNGNIPTDQTLGVEPPITIPADIPGTHIGTSSVFFPHPHFKVPISHFFTGSILHRITDNINTNIDTQIAKVEADIVTATTTTTTSTPA